MLRSSFSSIENGCKRQCGVFWLCREQHNRFASGRWGDEAVMTMLLAVICFNENAAMMMLFTVTCEPKHANDDAGLRVVVGQ